MFCDTRNNNDAADDPFKAILAPRLIGGRVPLPVR
jgi:hypothetical protein